MTRVALLLAMSLAGVLAACSSASSLASPSAPSQHSGSGASATASLSRCPAAVRLASLAMLAHLTGNPDDVTVDADGVLWVSDRDGNRILQLSPQGAMLHSFADPHGPEGIVVLGDGTVIVAQQVTNRLDVLHPGTGAFSTWLQLGATSSPTQGVDGIGIDGDTVLVPDSARGRLLTVPVGAGDAAGAATVVAGNLGRPVAAVRAPSGGYLVALENQPGLTLVRPGTPGSTPVLHLVSLDDLALVNGLVYATDLGDQSVIAVDPATDATRTLVTGAGAPQGLARTPNGELLLVDSNAQVLVRLRPC